MEHPEKIRQESEEGWNLQLEMVQRQESDEQRFIQKVNVVVNERS